VRGGQLIREARLRAGLTQTELAERTGRERSVIARWEQGAVSPSVDNLLAIVEACGYDLPLVLIPRDTSQRETLEALRVLSPERRLERYFAKVEAEDVRRG
jgi:transcriptional regulator with XRE-family HTH domain